MLDQFLSLFRHCKLSHFSPVSVCVFTRVSLCDCMLMPYDKVYSDGIRADPEASDMTTRSDGELDVVCPAQQLVVTMVISVIHLM